MDAIEELAICSRQVAPISIEAAILNCKSGDSIVKVVETVEHSEVWLRNTFHRFRDAGIVDKVQREKLWLKNGAVIMAMTEAQIRNGGVRGRNVIWIH